MGDRDSSISSIGPHGLPSDRAHRHRRHTPELTVDTDVLQFNDSNYENRQSYSHHRRSCRDMHVSAEASARQSSQPRHKSSQSSSFSPVITLNSAQARQGQINQSSPSQSAVDSAGRTALNSLQSRQSQVTHRNFAPKSTNASNLTSGPTQVKLRSNLQTSLPQSTKHRVNSSDLNSTTAKQSQHSLLEAPHSTTAVGSSAAFNRAQSKQGRIKQDRISHNTTTSDGIDIRQKQAAVQTYTTQHQSAHANKLISGHVLNSASSEMETHHSQLSITNQATYNPARYAVLNITTQTSRLPNSSLPKPHPYNNYFVQGRRPSNSLSPCFISTPYPGSRSASGDVAVAAVRNIQTGSDERATSIINEHINAQETSQPCTSQSGRGSGRLLRKASNSSLAGTERDFQTSFSHDNVDEIVEFNTDCNAHDFYKSASSYKSVVDREEVVTGGDDEDFLEENEDEPENQDIVDKTAVQDASVEEDIPSVIITTENNVESPNAVRSSLEEELDKESLNSSSKAQHRPGRVLADRWLVLEPEERLQRIKVIVPDIWAVQEPSRCKPFHTTVFEEQEWINLYNMAICEPIIYKELAQIVEARGVVLCGLHTSHSEKVAAMSVEDLSCIEKDYSFIYSMQDITPFDRLYTVELRIYLPSACGFYNCIESAPLVIDPDEQELAKALTDYRDLQAARLAELPFLVAAAHQAFQNLKTITFCGTMGRQKTWDHEALRGTIDDAYVHPGDVATPLQFLSGTEMLTKLKADTEDPAPEIEKNKKFRKLVKKTSRFFARQKTSATDDQDFSQSDTSAASRPPAEEKEYGAYRTFLTHNHVVRTMSYIKAQDKVNLIVFERGFFSNHETEDDHSARNTRAFALVEERGPVSASVLAATKQTLLPKDLNSESFIAKNVADFIHTENSVETKHVPFHTLGHLPGRRTDNMIEVERFQVRRATELWGVPEDGFKGRQNHLHFALYDNEALASEQK